jgi:hypothetical protein
VDLKVGKQVTENFLPWAGEVRGQGLKNSEKAGMSTLEDGKVSRNVLRDFAFSIPGNPVKFAGRVWLKT